MGTKTVGSMASASSTASKPVVAPETKTLAFPAKSEQCDEIKAETEPEVEDVGDRKECAAPSGDDAGGQHLHQGRSDSFGRPERPPSRSDTQRPLSSAEQRIAAAIRQHYYPEGGWGWVVCVCVCLVNALSWGMQLNYGVMHAAAVRQFGEEHEYEARERAASSDLVQSINGPKTKDARRHTFGLATRPRCSSRDRVSDDVSSHSVSSAINYEPFLDAFPQPPSVSLCRLIRLSFSPRGLAVFPVGSITYSSTAKFSSSLLGTAVCLSPSSGLFSLRVS
ncbi:hypothetical protein MRX96_016440 [Rhipicephalus microplus]